MSDWEKDARAHMALQKRFPNRDHRLTSSKFLVRALAEIDALREALEFYADPRRYDGPNQRNPGDDPHTRPDAAYFTDVTRDHGSRAVAALRATGRKE